MRANRVSKLVKYPYVYLTNFRFSRSRRHTIGRYSARESKLKIRNKISSFNVPFWSKIDFEYDCLNAFVATYTFQIRFPPKWNSIRKTFILRFQPIFACRVIRRLCTSLDLRIRQNAYPSSMESRCFRKCSLQRDFVTLDFRLTSNRRISLSLHSCHKFPITVCTTNNNLSTSFQISFISHQRDSRVLRCQ